MSWNSGLQSLLPIAITWGIIKNSDAWLPPARYFDLIGMGTTWASGFLKSSLGDFNVQWSFGTTVGHGT